MLSIRRVFLSRRMLVILFLGFSSGIPLALVGGTLQAWMASRSVDLTLIGIFSLVGVPYSLKFLWAPLMDRYIPPFLGRRRGWMVICQLALFLSIAAMAFCDPSRSPAVLALLAFCVAFFSASQDIVVDAYRTEILETTEYGVGAAVATLGFRVGMLFSGAFALILSDRISWSQVYLLMAASIGLGFLACLIAPEPKNKRNIPKTLREAVIEPFVDFFRRKNAGGILLFVTVYKMDVVVALLMMTPFMMQIGFSRTDIGVVTKGFGLIASILGTFVGGLWMGKLGLRKSLWVFGILQGISGFCFYLLAHLGHHYPMMVTTIAAENFFSGMGNSAYAAFLMTLCNPRFTATQYALLTSLMVLIRNIAGVPFGWVAQTFGWEIYYLISIFLMVPGLLLLSRIKSFEQRSD